ncbi:4-(cytidine 5'-diphospho)-2-C-methyl-D-erythritol kinase [Chloroflexota bacterium]
MADICPGRRINVLNLLAPAKINLTLEVLAKRQNGFHEIRSVAQAISLCDRLTFQSGEKIEFKSSLPEWIPEESLVSKAVNLLQGTTGCSRGATIGVSKRIPLVSGLGGDSSDAAATLRGLNQLWELGLSREELLELSSQLGSDVAFFLYGGTALLEGRGEIVTPLPPLPHRWVLIVMPPVPPLPEKTKQLYASLSANHYTDGQITSKLVEMLKAGGEFVSSLLFNTFENVAFTRFPEIGVSRAHIQKMGATNIHLAGSGPALFTLVEDKAQAEQLHTLLQKQRLVSYLIETLAAIEKAE